MKLVRYTANRITRLGKVVGTNVVDLSAIAPHGSMRQLLNDLPEIRGSIEAADEPALPLESVILEAPITDPQKFLAIGMNYQAHAQEAIAAGIPVPTSQLWFNKQVSCITGPASPIVYPAVSNALDYEAELAVVIGKRCRNVLPEDARSVIAGYTVANDVSARDWQHRTPTFTLGKSFDTHGPIGPWIITDDEILDPHALTLRLTVNGEERQSTLTGDMIYNIYDQIAYLSQVMTLEPGDILSTGTPSGVGAATNGLLKVGDVVRVEVSDVGVIENTIVSDG
ncbi:fumarylacetoacetate hydrolase family protein [Sphingobium sp. AS12]|nr:fumarylacetoacetate hydrolase family protein [Sphingobium sp. AS12]